MKHGFSFEFSDPEEMQEIVSPIIGQPPHIRPARGTGFLAKVVLKPKSKVGLFITRADSINVHIHPESPNPFFCINLPLGKPFSVRQAGQLQAYLFDINLTRPDRPMILQAGENCRVLAAILNHEMMQEYTARLTRSTRPLEYRMQTRLSMAAPAGHALVRRLARLWSEPLPDSQAPGTQIHLAELEDEVITNYILAATAADEDSDRTCPDASPHRFDLAEDFLCNHLDRPVLRADLAEVSGVSIRTLSRGFMRRHGMGPMQFLKARRLDAAYLDLLGSDPGFTSVTDVAMRYGFEHLGKFAIDYKRAFRESPSATLRG